MTTPTEPSLDEKQEQTQDQNQEQHQEQKINLKASFNSLIEFDIVEDLNTIVVEKKIKRSYNKKKV